MIHVETMARSLQSRASREAKIAGGNEVNPGQLRSIIERAERLREEKKALDEDLKEVFAEARGNGFDVPTIKEILKLRAADPDKRAEKEMLLDVYLSALGAA